MVMPGEVITAGSGHSLELMVGESSPEVPSGCRQSVMEYIIRVIHPVDFMHGFKADFIKAGIVGYKGVAFKERLNLGPDLRENRCVLSVLWS